MRYFEIATQLSRFFFAQDLRLVTHLTRPAPPARCVCLIFPIFSQLEPDSPCISSPLPKLPRSHCLPQPVPRRHDCVLPQASLRRPQPVGRITANDTDEANPRRGALFRGATLARRPALVRRLHGADAPKSQPVRRA